ncbi:MAG: alpha/beta hydrolase-fold protein [Chloroflexia bacterium]
MPTETPLHHQTEYKQQLKRRLERPIDARVRRIHIESKTLGVRKTFYVALPPGYSRSANTGQRYPTLYLFRGHQREWIHRQQDRSRRGRTVIDVYRDLLEEGKIGQLILVFPGISSEDNRVPGLLVNFREPELVKKVPGVGTGRFEDYFIQEIIPYVDGHYRTVADRQGRAVDGFSLGGFQAIKIAAQHPDLFCSAGAFDGTFLYATDRGRSVRKTDRVLRNPIFAPAFGSERDLEFAAANSPANLLWRGDRSALKDVQWLLRSGPRMAEPWQSNYYRTQHVVEIMRARGLENGLDPVFARARHSWYWADRHMAETLPLHWGAMGTMDGGR